MAYFDKSSFGKLRGKFGNFISRLRYGKPYISPVPSRYNTKSEKVKTMRKVFSRRQRLNHELRRCPKLREFWKTLDVEGLNDNTKLMIRNKDFVAYERLLSGIGITPVSFDKSSVKNIVIEDSYITFDFKLERAIPKHLEPPYDVFCVFILDRYFDEVDDGFIRRKSFYSGTDFQTIEQDSGDVYTSLRFRQYYRAEQVKYLAEKAYLMVAAVKYNDLKNKYEWTDTFFEELVDFIPEDKKKDYTKNIIKYDD